MDQVSANLSKQDPGHRVMPNRDKVTRRPAVMGIPAEVRRADWSRRRNPPHRLPIV